VAVQLKAVDLSRCHDFMLTRSILMDAWTKFTECTFSYCSIHDGSPRPTPRSAPKVAWPPLPTTPSRTTQPLPLVAVPPCNDAPDPTPVTPDARSPGGLRLRLSSRVPWDWGRVPWVIGPNPVLRPLSRLLARANARDCLQTSDRSGLRPRPRSAFRPPGPVDGTRGSPASMPRLPHGLISMTSVPLFSYRPTGTWCIALPCP